MSDVMTALQEALGEEVVFSAADLAPRFANDWSGQEPEVGKGVVRPRSTEEVATAMRICHEHSQGVVPQGGMTGVSGASRPNAGDVCLSLDRLNGIEEIDKAMSTMTVWAGTPLQMVQEAASEAGFSYPLDLGARGSCAIGGNIGTNAGGNRVIRYGMTRDMVLGLEVVLSDGTVVTSLNKLLKNNAGYDLKQLFIGSEGTLGVVTRAVLRLQPAARSCSTAVCGLAGFEATTAFLEKTRAGLGSTLSAFEVLWPRYYDLMVDHAAGVRAPLEGRHGMYVLMESQGFDPEHDSERFEDFLGEMLDQGIIADAAIAQSDSDTTAFWGIRDAVTEFPMLIGPHCGYDVGLPIHSMAPFLDRLEQRILAYSAKSILIAYGHMGDGNLHLVIGMSDRELGDKVPIDDIVYDELRQHGGTVTAEHGLGTLKKPYLAYCRSDAEITLMKRLKSALDPTGILNPGKTLP